MKIPLISFILFFCLLLLTLSYLPFKLRTKKHLAQGIFVLMIPSCIYGIYALTQMSDLLAYSDPFLIRFAVPLAATKETFHLSLFYSVAVLAIVSLLSFFAENIERQTETLKSTLEIYAINILFLFSDSGPLLLVFWIASFVPLYKYSRNSYKLAFLISSVLLAVAVICIGFDGKYALSLAEYKIKIGPGTLTQMAGIFALVAALIRQGVFPFHLWMRPLAEHAPFPMVLPFLVAQNGLFLLYHVAMPLLSYELRDALPLASMLGLFSSIYLAFSGLTDKKVRSVFLNIFLCQSMIVMVGIELTDTLSTVGAILQWMNLIVAGTGLGITIILTEARTDVRHYDQAGGIGLLAPKLSWFYFLFGFIMIGLPGALGFIGEDILFHAIVDDYPVLGISITLATCLNGILFYRSFSEIYQGPIITDYEIHDLKWRERIFLGSMLVILFVTGLFPRLLVDTHLFSSIF